MRNGRVKVKTELLLETVRERAVRDEKAYLKALPAYEAAVEKWREKVIKQLDRAFNDVRDGKNPDFGYNGAHKLPDKPRKPDKVDHSRVIKTLEMAADEAITISTGDYSYYLS